MLTRIIRKSSEKDKGFTLIELLVVIIIGVLAAVSIPLFLNQEKKAQDSAAKADVSVLGKEIATWMVDAKTADTLEIAGDGTSYNGTANPDLSSPKVGHQTKHVEVSSFNTTGADAEDWCVHVINDKGDKARTSAGGFKYSAVSGLEVGTC